MKNGYSFYSSTDTEVAVKLVAVSYTHLDVYKRQYIYCKNGFALLSSLYDADTILEKMWRKG